MAQQIWPFQAAGGPNSATTGVFRFSVFLLGTLGGIAMMLALGGCSALPTSGASTLSLAEPGLADPSGSEQLPFALVEITPTVLDAQRMRPQTSLAARLGFGVRRSDLRIAPGDVISVSLWEAPPGTLFSSTSISGQAVSTSGTVTIPSQPVEHDGTISVPYAGRIPVVGQTAAGIERAITKSREGKAVQPQALVSVQRSSQNTVTVTGEVAGGSRVALSAGGERVLDVIAAAGGLRGPVAESVVEVTRGGATARAQFQSIVQAPRENIYMRPGDVVTVIREPRTFTVLGATGRNAEIPFEARTVSMAEALAKAGGLLDYRADASGVFVFRIEPVAIAEKFLPPTSRFLNSSSGYVPVVYRFNLLDAKTMLMLNQFFIEPKDVIYVSNASSTDLQKFLNIFQAIAGPAISGAAIGVAR